MEVNFERQNDTIKLPFQIHVYDSNNIFYLCKYCQTNFSVKYDLRTHIRRNHLPEQGSACTLCDQNFASQKELTAHLFKTHFQGRRALSCMHCTKTFRDSILLEKHLTHHKLTNNNR